MKSLYCHCGSGVLFQLFPVSHILHRGEQRAPSRDEGLHMLARVLCYICLSRMLSQKGVILLSFDSRSPNPVFRCERRKGAMHSASLRYYNREGGARADADTKAKVFPSGKSSNRIFFSSSVIFKLTHAFSLLRRNRSSELSIKHFSH